MSFAFCTFKFYYFGQNIIQQHYRAIFISDIHLGSPDCKAEYLLECLNQFTCDKLYLVGDIIDLWYMQKQFKWPEAHNAVFHKLIKLSHGPTQVIYLPGNHDRPLQRYDGLSIGDIPVQRDIVHTTAAGKQFLVLHGDQFDEHVTLGKFEAWLGDKGYDLLLWLNRSYNHIRHMRKASYWSLAGYIKAHIKGANAAIHRYKVAACQDATKRGLDGVICGHIHHPEYDEIGGITYCNDGDWVENCSLLCENQEGELMLVDWIKQRQIIDTQSCNASELLTKRS